MNAVMIQRRCLRLLVTTMLLFQAVCGLADSVAQPTPDTVERGRYLVQIAGCNDCHTAGYLLSEGQIPESDWLQGDQFGWRGPWGTTYATNLRLRAAGLSESDWLEMARTLRTRPPMPWYMLNTMHTEDLVAIYQYLRYMGAAGDPAPVGLSPEQEPIGPYAQFPGQPAEGEARH